MKRLIRFTISIESGLAEKFGNKIISRGYANRSQAIADLIRKDLVKQEWSVPKGEVVGTITLVYNYHQRDIVNRLVSLQHRFHAVIVSTTHIHMDQENCLEVLVVKSKTQKVRELHRQLIGLKGIKFCELSTATSGKHLT